MITKEQLVKFTGQNLADKYYQPLVDGMIKYEINTKLRASAFLAQILHESGNLIYSKELTGHTTKSLMETWKSIFPTVESTLPYLHQPEKLFNYVYGTGKLGRMLGNIQPGDGWRFVGRGFIGETGRTNYTILAKDTGIDFVNHPEWLELPQYAFLSAFEFWKKYNLNTLADQSKFIEITHQVNGGEIGEDDREKRYKLYLSIVI